MRYGTDWCAWRGSKVEDFETVLAAMRAGRIPAAALDTHRLRLHDLPARLHG